MFSQASVILFTIGLMATWSLLILVMAWSVCILLECFLVHINVVIGLTTAITMQEMVVHTIAHAIAIVA